MHPSSPERDCTSSACACQLLEGHGIELWMSVTVALRIVGQECPQGSHDRSAPTQRLVSVPVRSDMMQSNCYQSKK